MDDTRRHARATAPAQPALHHRLAIGVGDPQREWRLLPALEATGAFVAERCLTAEHLLARVQSKQVDVALVASDLPRLGGAMLAELSRTRVPLVVLTADPAAERWAPAGAVLPLEATPAQVREALDAVLRGDQPRVATPRTAEPGPGQHTVAPAPTRDETAASATMIVVASGAGSPGRTTVALGLAAALGAVAPTVLVDADLAGPSLAAHLDADPTRNLSMLAHGDPRTRREWDRALAQETQPLGPHSPYGAVLCGVPKPAMRAGVSPPFFARAVE